MEQTMKSLFAKIGAILVKKINPPDWLCAIWMRLVWVMLFSQTASTRFWFGLVGIGFSSYMISSSTIHSPISEYQLLLQIAPDWVWAIGFLTHGCALIYGVLTHTYNKLLMVLEGILGTVVWTTSAVVIVITQNTIGAQAAAALIAVWLLVRYPTHWEYKDAN